MQLNIQHHFGVNVIVYYPIEILNLYIIKWIWKRSLLTHMARIPCKVQLHLAHWGRMTHICVGELAIFGSDNGLSPGRRQAIIWTNAGILSIGPLGTNFSKILIEMQTFSFKKTHLKMSSGKKSAILSRPQCVNGLLVYTITGCSSSSYSSSSYINSSSLNKMAPILQTFPNAFSWMKLFEFRLKLHRSLFLRVKLTTFQHCRMCGAKPLS